MIGVRRNHIAKPGAFGTRRDRLRRLFGRQIGEVEAEQPDQRDHNPTLRVNNVRVRV